MEGERTDQGAALELPIPLTEGDLFKHGASERILEVLVDNPDLQLSITQLSNLASFSKPATRAAVDTLEANDLVETTRRGNARLTQINRKRLRTADDPILSIPQDEYHLPVRIGRDLVESELEDVLGVVLFGSVARGEADRQSDVDLWVLVGHDPTRQQHEATKLATELSEMKLPSAIDTADLLGDQFTGSSSDDGETTEQSVIDVYSRTRLSADSGTSWQQFLHRQLASTGHRYDFEIVVESPDSVAGQLEAIDPAIFTEGITLYDTQTLQNLKAEVIGGE